MEIYEIVLLALVQGLTEFLPISSSAHLILIPYLLGLHDQGLAFDVAVHMGSLGAVITYFRHEVVRMALAWGNSLRGRGHLSADGRLAWLIVLATLPILIGGLMMKGLVETGLRSTFVIATTTVLFGLLLYWFDLRGSRSRDEHTLSARDALVIGMFQVLAIVPGTSRSGITITAGMMLGLTRRAASRFSFLLSIPTILMSGTLVTVDLVRSDLPVEWDALALGVILSFGAAYLCIKLFLQMIEKIGMLPFVLYRLALGALLFTLPLWH